MAVSRILYFSRLAVQRLIQFFDSCEHKTSIGNNIFCRSILADDDDHEVVKMMFFVVDDEEMKKARKTINDVIGLDKPNTGIMFALPVSFVEGLGA